MNGAFERYVLGTAVLVFTLLLLGTELNFGFILAFIFGLTSSLLFFLGAQNIQSLRYKWAKNLLFVQISVFFITISVRIGFVGIVLGFVTFMICYYLLKLSDSKRD